MIKESLNYSGIASIQDFQTETWNKIFDDMQKYQKLFLAKENEFRSNDYKWPGDALNNWSRVWEYPYVFFHLKQLVESHNVGNKLLDVGSGVTFFTTFLAENGFNITATDIDPIAEKDLKKAIGIIKPKNGKANFKLCTEDSLPFNDSEFDIVTSVSVIEHVTDLEKNISEINRVLKPGGYFVLTFDLDLSGLHELKPAQYDEFIDILEKYFNFHIHNEIIHPNYNLTPKNSIKPATYYQNNFNAVFKRFKNSIKKVLGIKYFDPGFLTIQGAVLKKKDL